MQAESSLAGLIVRAVIPDADSEAAAAVATGVRSVCVPIRSVPGDGLAAHDAQIAATQQGATARTFSLPSIEQAVCVQATIKFDAVAALANGARQRAIENKTLTAVRILSREGIRARHDIDHEIAAYGVPLVS